MSRYLFIAGALLCAVVQTPALAQTAPAEASAVRPERVRAHVGFLAGEALQGRGSATRDEAIAAAYVAAQFESIGLRVAPGMQGYLQRAQVVRSRLTGAPSLTRAGTQLEGATLFRSSGNAVAGEAAVYKGADPAGLPAADVVVATDPGFSLLAFFRSPAASRVKLLILRESDATRTLYGQIGGAPMLPDFLAGEEPSAHAAVVTLPAAAIEALAAKPGAETVLTVPVARDASTTTNAIGYLPGTDPEAGVLLVSAHHDHLGVRSDGKVMYGANDDASGTAAVIELARALAAGKPMRRGILFVTYGTEEIGGFGSKWFAAHPPVPLGEIVANLGIEMIGTQDPRLPAGTMMMTGFERSTMGETLKAHGGLVTADPYPGQHFFERSDNYSLALQGVVAHTISGWATTPTYHTPGDTVDKLDIAFMTRAIQSLVAPLRALANSDARPEWKPGGRPQK